MQIKSALENPTKPDEAGEDFTVLVTVNIFFICGEYIISDLGTGVETLGEVVGSTQSVHHFGVREIGIAVDQIVLVFGVVERSACTEEDVAITKLPFPAALRQVVGDAGVELQFLAGLICCVES